jgi:hypothetical protein
LDDWFRNQFADERDYFMDRVGNLETLKSPYQVFPFSLIEEIVLKDPMHDY